MKGYRFYAELPPHRGSKSASAWCQAFTRANLTAHADLGIFCNVVAVIPEQRTVTGCYDAIFAVRGITNSPVTGGTIGREHLRKRCVRISEKLARKLHPALFDSGLI